MTFIENVVKYTNVMQYVKENVADIIILILLAVWGIYEVLMIPFLYDTIVSVFISCSLVCLFPWACKSTKIEYQRIRNGALRYSFTFMIALLGSLKIVEETFFLFGIFLISSMFLNILSNVFLLPFVTLYLS